jgi:hypothetical protein
VPEVTEKTDWMQGQSSFQFNPTDIPRWNSYDGAEVVVGDRWVESRLPLSSIDYDSSLFRCRLRSVFRLEKDDLYYIVNAREVLDEPGEWFFDSSKQLLYYWPLPDEPPATIDAIVPALPQLVRIEGEPHAGNFVENLHFKGITFSHTEWWFPDSGKMEFRPEGSGGFVQAAVGLPAAIEAIGLRNSSFEQCNIAHVGGYAIALRAGCQSNRIERTTLTDLGGGGVKIGETGLSADARVRTSHNTVIDCEIGDGGKIFHSAIGIWAGQSSNNRIIHNRIHDFLYSGISIGWTWGYGPSAAGGNFVELNHIHHIGTRQDGDGGMLGDMGGIYTLGKQPGTVIRNNLFHDIQARYMGWGIYFDEGSTGVLAENNIVYRTSDESFHQHYGRENVVRNNIFAFGGTAQVRRSRTEPHTSFAFEGNIIYWAKGPMFGGNWRGGEMVFDRNVYWCGVGSRNMTDSMAWDAWRAQGFDPHSRFEDPLFLNPQQGDFTLRKNSPAPTFGFKPISVERILDPKPLSALEEHDLTRKQMHRLLFNSDGTNILMACDSATRNLGERVDALAGTAVTTFLLCPNPGQLLAYPSKVGEMFRFEKPLDRLHTRIDTLFWNMNHTIQTLLQDSLDPVDLILRRARLRGMETMLTYRMNELHDVDRPDSPLLSNFWKSHPGWRVGGYAGWGASALNFAVPEVREHTFRILQEICERYDLDGLELDFMRFPYYFPYEPSRMKAYADTMTAFVSNVRTMAGEVSRKKGRGILLAARVPSSLKSCAYVGLDVGSWCRKGLIDFLTVAPFLSTENDIPVREFKAVCGSVPVYAGTEYTVGWRMMIRVQTRAAAALYLHEGADGIYLFNYFIPWDERAGLEPDFAFLKELTSPDSLARKDKLYTLPVPKYPIPNVSLSSPMPLRLRPFVASEVTLRVHEPERPASLVLQLEADVDVNPSDLVVQFNGRTLIGARRPDVPQLFPRRIPHPLPPTSHLVVFDVPSGLMRERNSVRITTKQMMTLETIDLAVRH